MQFAGMNRAKCLQCAGTKCITCFRVCPNLASVLSPRTAAKATFALKAGVWFRRGRFVMVSPVRHTSWPLSGRNSTHPAVQISKASSDHAFLEDFHRARHVADLVLMIDNRDDYGQLVRR